MAITVGPPKAFMDALIRARAIGPDDLPRIRQILIDIRPHEPVTMTIEYIGDDSVHLALTELAGHIERG